MNAYLANKAIIDRFASEWLTAPEFAGDPPPYILDNEIALEPTDADQWVRIVTRENRSTQETVGIQPSIRRDGTIYIQCFTPAGEGGAKSGLELAVIARRILERVTTEGVRMLAASVRPADNEGSWWNVTVEVPFWYRETLS